MAQANRWCVAWCILAAGCAQDRKHPQALFRECVLEQARVVAAAKEEAPTYAEGLSFGENCDELAHEAALEEARESLGNKFNPDGAKTQRFVRAAKHDLIRSHACALSENETQDCPAVH